MAKILVLNGPNLNLLGEREPHIYGYTTLAEINRRCKAVGKQLGFGVTCKQSNHEGEMVDVIQAARKTMDGIVINPAAYSFTSMAVFDALKASKLPVVEVHISNIHRREEMYHKSFVSLAATAVICGMGPYGYEAALLYLANHFRTLAA